MLRTIQVGSLLLLLSGCFNSFVFKFEDGEGLACETDEACPGDLVCGEDNTCVADTTDASRPDSDSRDVLASDTWQQDGGFDDGASVDVKTTADGAVPDVAVGDSAVDGAAAPDSALPDVSVFTDGANYADRMALTDSNLPDAYVSPDGYSRPDAYAPSDLYSPPDALAPDTSQPDTWQPDTWQPDTSQPDTWQPDISQPDTIDVSPPSVNITSPVHQETVRGEVLVEALASDNEGIDRVEFYVNNVHVGTANTAPYSVSWNTRQLSSGNYHLKAVAYDVSGISTTDDDTTVVLDNRFMFWSYNDGIKRAALDGSDVIQIVGGYVNSDGLALDQGANKIYWVESDNDDGAIRRCNLDGTNIETLVSGLLGPKSVALDINNNKMYWVQYRSGTGSYIKRADMEVPADSANNPTVETLYTFVGLKAPLSIALDLDNRAMYWADFYGTIGGMPMDGPYAEEILVSGGDSPRGVALDLQNEKIYWTEDGNSNSVRRADLAVPGDPANNGSLEILVSGLEGPWGMTLDLANGEMYWVDRYLSQIQKAEMVVSPVVQNVAQATGSQSRVLCLDIR